MAKEILEKDVHKSLEQIKHPAINSTLIDLGIIKEISTKKIKSQLL